MANDIAIKCASVRIIEDESNVVFIEDVMIIRII